jgi:4-hydroxy-3-polyprenylbenzoate decarboxylase
LSAGLSTGSRLIVAVTGASGAIYALRLLKACLELGLRVDLLVSDYGKRLLIEECELNLKTATVEEWLDRTYGAAERPGKLIRHNVDDLGAAIASGSQQWDAMVVVPCSMKTLAGIANGASTNLIERAGDVTLKERRPLILVPRETPLNLVQLENLTRAARAGAVVVPAMPAFYHKPQSIDDLADFIAGRVLSLLGLRHDLFPPWTG